MASEWTIIGQVGEVKKLDGDRWWMVSIADNKYKPDKNRDNKWKKVETIWFNCLCDFKPRVASGDRVIAKGTYIQSRNENIKYSMKVSHIGVIQSQPEVNDP